MGNHLLCGVRAYVGELLGQLFGRQIGVGGSIGQVPGWNIHAVGDAAGAPIVGPADAQMLVLFSE